MKKIYFKHSLITSGSQQDVEDEINVFNNEYSDILGVTVTPERVGEDVVDGYKYPKYVYHVCITYQDRD